MPPETPLVAKSPPQERMRKGKLVDELHIAWTTLDKFLRMPGAPPPDAGRTYNVEACRIWCDEQAAKAKASNTTTNDSPFDRLRQEKIRQEIEHSRFLFEKQRGEYIHRSEIAGTLWALQAEADNYYRQKFEHELPFKYKGRSPVECQQMNIAALDQIAKRIREGCLPLTGKEEKESA